jgi:hypothetical protein
VSVRHEFAICPKSLHFISFERLFSEHQVTKFLIFKTGLSLTWYSGYRIRPFSWPQLPSNFPRNGTCASGGWPIIIMYSITLGDFKVGVNLDLKTKNSIL